jgi:triphosphoribosyl-dephospho-CoA synthetase
MIDYEGEHIGHTLYREIIRLPREQVPENWDGIYTLRDLELAECAGEISRDSINTRITGALALRQFNAQVSDSVEAIKAANELSVED